MIKLSIITESIENHAPSYLAGDWDNVGLILGDRNKNVKKVLLSLDVDLEVAREAAAIGADVIISHHPLIFNPIKKINNDTKLGECIMFLIKNDIAVYSAHTNLDAAPGGLNDYLTHLYGLLQAKATDIVYTDNEGVSYGLGRVGVLPCKMTLAELAKYIGEKLSVSTISYVGNPLGKVSRVAICSGGGGGKISSDIASFADVYITGDIKYSGARDAAEMGLNLIAAQHFDTEIFCMDIFEKIISSFDIEIYKSIANKNVFKTIII